MSKWNKTSLSATDKNGNRFKMRITSKPNQTISLKVTSFEAIRFYHTKFAFGLSLSVSHSHIEFCNNNDNKWNTLIRSCQHKTHIPHTRMHVYRSFTFTWSGHPFKYRIHECVRLCVHKQLQQLILLCLSSKLDILLPFSCNLASSETVQCDSFSTRLLWLSIC